MKISVIVAVYNERGSISKCVQSLLDQSRQTQLILVDDGSTDDSRVLMEKLVSSNTSKKIILLSQKHQGPGAARNLGAMQATGEILVFVDADMTFTPDFIDKLVAPIEKNEFNGTFTKAEYVSNWENRWARCWNYRQGLRDKRRLPQSYPNQAPVFRAVLKKEFNKVGGYTAGVGWTDDWTLGRKLGYQAQVTEAKCFHENPATLIEVFEHAQWVGKNEFISGSLLRSLVNTLRYAWPLSLIRGFIGALEFDSLIFPLFVLVYDIGVTWGILTALTTQDRNK